MATITYTGELVVTSCWCGIALAIPDDLHRLANTKKKAIHCPLGHQFVYSSTTEDKLKETAAQLERSRQRERATRDLLTHEENSHRTTRGHVTRLKKRAAAGVCPCCTRTFRDLARHMAGQHPDYVKS